MRGRSGCHSEAALHWVLHPGLWPIGGHENQPWIQGRCLNNRENLGEQKPPTAPLNARYVWWVESGYLRTIFPPRGKKTSEYQSDPSPGSFSLTPWWTQELGKSQAPDRHKPRVEGLAGGSPPSCLGDPHLSASSCTKLPLTVSMCLFGTPSPQVPALQHLSGPVTEGRGLPEV